MISSFRRYLETWYVRAFFLLMVASFVLWGVGDMLRVIGTTSWAAKVAGTTIETQTLDAEYRRALTTASRDLPPGQDVSPEMRRAVLEQTLQRLIGQAAIGKTLRDMRIAVPEPALVETTRTMPAFKGAGGSFDRTRFDAVLRNNGISEAGFLEIMRGDLARRQLIDAVTAGAFVPAAEAESLYATRFEKRAADIAGFPFADTPEPPIPDDATARRWYDNHPELYATPEYRRLKLVVLSPRTIAAEIPIADTDVKAAYEAHIAEFTVIPRRSARVISVTDEAKAAALAGQWRAGADWAAMEAAAKQQGAAAIVQDDATAAQFPDPDLAKAVFSSPPDTVSGPIKGVLGWFVIQVTRAVEGGVTPFDQVKDRLRERVLTEKALDLVYERANKIDGLIANGTTLDTLPGDLGVAVVTAVTDQRGFTPDGAEAAIPGETEIRAAILAAAFQTPKNDPPHLTEAQTPSTGGSGYFVLTVDDIVPSGQKPFEPMRDAAAADWRADQRRHAAEQAAAAMLKAVQDGKPFSDAARDAGVVPRLTPLVMRTTPDPALPPEVHQVLFGLKAGEPTMVESPEGFLVAVPVEIVAPDPRADPTGFEQLRGAVARTVASDLANTLAEALRLRANPRINQANVDQIVQP